MNSEERESVKGPAPGPVEANPRMDNGPIPGWLIAVIGFGIFWAGAYLFSYSGGFAADVFDYQPKYGRRSTRSEGTRQETLLGQLRHLPSSKRTRTTRTISSSCRIGICAGRR